jgi:hypothetical protein
VKVKSQVNNLNSKQWFLAAQEAKKQLSALKKKAARLRNSVRIFEENARTGEPWPGHEPTIQN